MQDQHNLKLLYMQHMAGVLTLTSHCGRSISYTKSAHIDMRTQVDNPNT